MTYNSYKQTITIALANIENKTSGVNKILIGCLVLRLVRNIVELDKNKNGIINDLVERYINTYKGVVESLEGKYVSYKEIKLLLSQNNITDFSQVTESLLNKIVDLYEIKTKIQTFDTHFYSQYMYEITFISDEENQRLEKVHNKIIVPIIEFLKTFVGIRMTDVSVTPLDFVNRNYSKCILLSVNGVNSSELYNIITRDACDNMKYIQNVSMTSDGHVKLLIK